MNNRYTYTVILDWINVREPMLPGEMWREGEATGYQVGCESSLEEAREHFNALRKVAPSSLNEDGYPADAIRAYEARSVVYERYTIVRCGPEGEGETLESVWVEAPVGRNNPEHPRSGAR